MSQERIEAYVREQAEDFGVPFEDAMVLFSVLGESEMYDGFISMLEDMADDFF